MIGLDGKKVSLMVCVLANGMDKDIYWPTGLQRHRCL